jgi:hypothetical protein
MTWEVSQYSLPPRTTNSLSVTGIDKTEAALERRAIASVESFMMIRLVFEKREDDSIG